MDAAALAGLCALLAHGAAPQSLSEGVSCAPEFHAPATGMTARRLGVRSASLAGAVDAADARDGIARVAFAEAGNQGDSGLAGVVYTILNRLQGGRWGWSVDGVLNAPHQFEPVMRAGGSWRNLPPLSEARRARIDTIINLALEGRLPDLTNGAQYFQNPRIVAARASTGQVAASLVNFGGAAPSAVIGAHSYYVELGRGGERRVSVASPIRGRISSDVLLIAAGGAIFVGENRAGTAREVAPVRPADEPLADKSSRPAPADSIAPAGELTGARFVRADGQMSTDGR